MVPAVPTLKVLDTIKSTLGEEAKVEEEEKQVGPTHSIDQVKIELVDEEAGKSPENGSRGLPKVDISSIEVKKEDMGISAFDLGEELVVGKSEKATPMDGVPDNLFNDVSSISSHSKENEGKEKDKSSFGVAFPF